MNSGSYNSDQSSYVSNEIQAIIKTTTAYTTQLESLNSYIKNFIENSKDSIRKYDELTTQQTKNIEKLSEGFLQMAENQKRIIEVLNNLTEFHTNVDGGLTKKLKELEENFNDEIKENTGKLFLKITGLYAVITGVFITIQEVLSKIIK